MKFSTFSKLMLLVAITTSISNSYAAAGVKSAEFRTLKSCLDGIKKSTGQSLKIFTDTPNEVSGFLSNGEGFACEKVESGTKGVFYKGWYLTK